MSEKISLKKLAQLAGRSKNASPEGKAASNAKKKGTMLPLEDKKKAMSKYKAMSSRAASKETSKGETPIVALEGVVVLTSSLAGCSRELRDEVMTQQSRANSFGTEMYWAQQLAKELEEQLADIGAREQRVIEEMKKMKEDRDATVERLEAELTELKKKEALTKKSAIEGYMSSTSKTWELKSSCSMRRRKRRRRR
ncbi:hypothetical protein Acr_00g0036950 [Actinidia rufa]|uniref:Uncharacterized protein n=1 Tax=Actinidia rufa TaxID=165716 RepID=A0A7J0DIM1_9ERIC|nr:hypothetical protein Acr_00g0036950 [Actinidia rufa]